MAVVALAWMTAQRVGSILKLQTNAAKPGRSVQFHLFKNKDTASGVYPFSLLAGRLGEDVKKWVETRRQKGKAALFNVSWTTLVRTMNSLKVSKHKLTGHSFRRGVLRELVRLKCPLKDLLRFSGHKTEKQLWDHLDMPPFDVWTTQRRMQIDAANLVEGNRQ